MEPLRWSIARWRSSWLIALGVVGLTLLTARLSVAAATQPVKEQKVAREAKGDTQALEKKLDKVLEAQDQILQRLTALQDELQVVKVRCTR